MKRGLLVLGLFLVFQAQAQVFSLNDLMGMADFSLSRFDAYVAKKDFKRDYFSPAESQTATTYFQQKKIKDEVVLRTFSFQEDGIKKTLSFQTSSQREAMELDEQISRAGFVSYSEKKEVQPALLQKDNMIILQSQEIRDSTVLFSYVIEKKNSLKGKEVSFAEDLLQFDSHEYLSFYFGKSNVRKDVFYYSENETDNCSILFPGTPAEVTFIWKDEVNYRQPTFLIIGGTIKPNSLTNLNRPIQQNSWRSRQGVYPGMSLKELETINEGEISFYAWHLEEAGVLTPKNSGHLDFKRLGIVLNCLNCNDGGYRQAHTIQSGQALAEDRKIYVSTLIILPEKDVPATAFK